MSLSGSDANREASARWKMSKKLAGYCPRCGGCRDRADRVWCMFCRDQQAEKRRLRSDSVRGISRG